MEEFQRLLIDQLTIEPARIPVVIIAGIGSYLGFLVLVKLFGVRVLAKMTAFDAVVIVMFGAVAGRVVIGHPPTLLSGIIGLATLMGMEAIFGAARNMNRVRRTFDTRPRVVFAHGKMIEKEMSRTHLSRSDIRLAARRAGVHSMDEIQCIILEPTGDLSLYREGKNINPELLRGVSGVDQIYP